jgi:hypothetical protein
VIPLLIGTLLALGAMAFVLAPLFSSEQASIAERSPASSRANDEHERGERAVDALREIEFDRATGKLSDADYDALKARYTAQALAAMRSSLSGAARGPTDADVEALIRRQRETRLDALSCPTHGPRPEADAVYCSDCGRYLAGVCSQCGAAPSAPGARFCDSCGHRLAA